MTVTAPPVVALRQFIAGTWEEGSGDFLISSNPARPREAVAEGQQATSADVNRAVTAAGTATRDWSRTPMHERGAVLLRGADHLTGMPTGSAWNWPGRKAKPSPRRGPR